MMLGRNNENAYSGISAPIYVSTSMKGALNNRIKRIKSIGQLTSHPCFPVLDTHDDILELEFLSGCTELVILLESPNDYRPLCLSKELSSVRKILNDPVRYCSGNHGEQPF